MDKDHQPETRSQILHWATEQFHHFVYTLDFLQLLHFALDEPNVEREKL